MSTTKPPRRHRPGGTQPRTAPAYKRLSHEQYAALDEMEKRRHDMHLDVDAIIDAVPYAQLDKESIGFPTALGGGGGGGGADPGALNSVEAASQHKLVDRATGWLAEWSEARAHVIRAANQARAYYGFDPDRGRPEPGRPQPRPDRFPDVELCAFCGQPAPSGRDEKGKSLLRRVDDKPVHASPCYWTLAKQAIRAGVSVKDHLHGVSNRSNPKSAGS